MSNPIDLGMQFGPKLLVADLSVALSRTDALLASNPQVPRKPTPLVQVATRADSSVRIGIRPWVSVQDFPTSTGDINKAVLESFRACGIAIPFPQREVRLLGQV